MSLNATTKSGFLVPAGPKIGRCYSIVDTGTHVREFEGKKRLRHEVRISWEIPAVRVPRDDGEKDKPASVHKVYTVSMDKKAKLRADLQSWSGVMFTPEHLQSFTTDGRKWFERMLSKPAFLNVVHEQKQDGSPKAVVASVTALMDGMTCPVAENPALIYVIEDGENDVFKSFPDWLKEEIKSCIELQPKKQIGDDPQDIPPAVPKDDIPF